MKQRIAQWLFKIACKLNPQFKQPIILPEEPSFSFKVGTKLDDILYCLEPLDDKNRTPCTFSGSDMKITIGSKVIAEAQAIKLETDFNDQEFPVYGKLTLVLFDRSILHFIQEEMKKNNSITILACNESGQIAKCSIFGVELIKSEWEVSIDDIITEECLYFKARSIDGFRPWKINEDKFNNLLEN